MRWFRSLVFLIISLGYFSDLYAGKINMNSTCAYCGDRFVCGAINEVVKLKFNFSKKPETAKIKDHCETLSVSTSERIKAEGTKSESDLRHETTKAYIEEIVLKSKKKRKSDSLRKRFEKGVKLGELKYYSQPDKKSSQKVYKKLIQARLVIPLKSFDEYKSTYPERAALNYRTYVKDILTQDPYHLSTKGNYEGYYTFALYPDGDVLKANQALVRNTASVGGSLGGGGSGGGSSGASPKGDPNPELMRAPAVPGGEKLVGGSAEAESSPKATLNDQGQWVVENGSSGKLAKPVDMRVLNNGSGSNSTNSGGTDFGAGSDLMNFYKTSGNSGTQTFPDTKNKGSRRTTNLDALRTGNQMLVNQLGSSDASVHPISSTSSLISRPVASRDLQASPTGGETVRGAITNQTVVGEVKPFSADIVAAVSESPGVTSDGTSSSISSDSASLKETYLGPRVEEQVFIASNSRIQKKLYAKQTALDSTDLAKGSKEKSVVPKSSDVGFKDKTTASGVNCEAYEQKFLEYSRQEAICSNDLVYFQECEKKKREEVLLQCEKLFGVEFDPKIDSDFVEKKQVECEERFHTINVTSDRKNRSFGRDARVQRTKKRNSVGDYKSCQQMSTSVERCYSRIVKLVDSYQPKEPPKGAREKENLLSIWQLEADLKVVDNMAIKYGSPDELKKNLSAEICKDNKSIQYLALQRIFRQSSKKLSLSYQEKECKSQVDKYFFEIVEEFPFTEEVASARGVFEKSVNFSLLNRKFRSSNREPGLSELKKLFRQMK
ncbi:MAG: hypothetical protein VX642_09690, partial [Bdellovibrionota bacterium]|nr:hypothetical protein [Bdellovibrionota bacterium]